MSFALSSRVCEPIYHSSKYISGKINPRAPMRLLFPGGWDNKVSDVFAWYESQKQRHFRQIQYYKEKQGVGHEFIVLPLQDAHGEPTESLCRIERMADPSTQLSAIGPGGTEAHDYVQSFDSSKPCENEPLGPLRDAGLVATITLHRDFDLYDVLAICSTVAEHRNARRYTLQQYNCYFFCWAIILSLSRRSADWEHIALRGTDDIRTHILQSVAAPLPAQDAKLAHLLSSTYSSASDPTQLLLQNALQSELSSPEFSCLVQSTLSTMLWANTGQTRLKHGLENRSEGLAKQTLEVLTGRLDIDPDAMIEHSLKGDVDLGPGVGVRKLGLEVALAFAITASDISAATVKKECEHLKQMHARNQIQQDTEDLITDKALLLITQCFAYPYIHTRLTIPQGIAVAYTLASFRNDIAQHQGQNKAICTLKHVGHTLRYLPRSLRISSKLASATVFSAMVNIVEGYESFPDANAICNLRALELTILDFLQKIPKQDGRSIPAAAFQLAVVLSKNNDTFNNWSPRMLWQRLLWKFLGDIIAGAILAAALTEYVNGMRFDCLQPTQAKEPLGEEPKPAMIPIVQLQQFIEERIIRLSKHDIDHAPIIKHMPIPAMAPPLRSQQEMKDTLEQIWCTANKGKRFKEEASFEL